MAHLKRYKIIGIVCILHVLLFPSISYAKTQTLPVPFSSQAPDDIWTEPWRNACEEASSMMVELFYFGYSKRTIDIETAKEKINQLVKLENKHLGFHTDTNAKQIAEMINLYLPWEAYTVPNPTREQIQSEIDAGHPVIIPVHGRELNNAHYKTEQVDYHVLVISGYDDETGEFITQEPATDLGLDYRYPYDTIMTAIHDFLPRDRTFEGDKTAVFTRKEIITSKDTDGDNDGLLKIDELKHGTILWLDDSDGDGYTDGHEVKNNYSPIIAETALPDGTLIKSKDNPDVYMIERGTKRKIINMEVFINHGLIGTDIRTVSQKFIVYKLKKGEEISK
ncbi:MAG TPA: hypothetical protein DCS29_00345 [Candidatus Magasanikbacteria bacterium]|nr:hypothetical protein [Candidatus Magasanikbacteria bacterium]